MLRKLTNGIPDLMASFRNNIDDFNKDICFVGTALFSRGQDLGNLLPQIFATYIYCSLDNVPFTRYIEMLENQYNNGPLNLEPKDLMHKIEVKYNQINDKLKLKGKSKLEGPILVLKSEIKKLKAVAAITNTKYVVTVKCSERSCEIPNWMKTPPKNGKLYK